VRQVGFGAGIHFPHLGGNADEFRSGEPEKTGDGKVLAPSAPCSEKRLSERRSLNIEVSGRVFVPGDVVPATEESRYEWGLGTDGGEVGDIHNDGGRPAFDRPAVMSGLES